MVTLTTQAQVRPEDGRIPKGNPTPTRDDKVMRILIAGAGGVIGSAVTPYLASQGHEVVRLVRRVPGAGEVRWDPDVGTIDCARLEGFDGVIHVASLPQSRWTSAFKKRWRDNHVGTNRLLAETLASRERKPGVLVCASAQGVYPPSGDQVLTEDSAVGAEYLAQLLRDGEAATAPASAAGIRVVHLRVPTVLGGSNLSQMVAGARRGMSISRFGSGRQWMSWVARDELSSIVRHALVTDALEGPVNATSPNAVRNAEFFATLSRVLGCKPRLLMPALLLRLLLGDMAEALILASRRIEPRRLIDTGYQFHFPELEAALRHELVAMG
jgi:uncharacterized protein (TIGR01777 family)